MIMPTLAHSVCVCLFRILNFDLFCKTSAMLVNMRVNFLLDVRVLFVGNILILFKHSLDKQMKIKGL